MARGDDQEAVIRLLADPATHGGRPVERIDTHGAVVFLAGDRAYKLKRAVRYPFMDFSTRAKRRRAVAAELRLNRRTAPRLYLSDAAVRRRSDGRLALDVPAGRGPALERLVVMRRFDQDGLFDRRAAAGRLSAAEVEAAAEAVARFHDGAAVLRRAGGSKGAEDVAAGNAERLTGYTGPVFAEATVASVVADTRRWLARLAPILEARRRRGRVRRCHGDLHLRNICLVDGAPTIFDCIEFNPALAEIDVAYDLAFLIMDLDHRGLGEHANRVLNRWCWLTGDYEAASLMPLLLSLRAQIRAHVGAAMAAVQRSAAARRAQVREARAYLDLAGRYLRPPPAAIVAIGGLSGTGKTTVARALAPRLGPPPGALVLRSDVLRKALMGVGELERLGPDGYADAVTRRVFRRLATLSRQVAAAGHAVIADAVFGKPAQRRAMREAAARAGTAFAGLWLEAPTRTLEARIRARRGDASDATVAVLRRQAEAIRTPQDWAHVPAGGGVARVAAAARRALAAALAAKPPTS